MEHINKKRKADDCVGSTSPAPDAFAHAPDDDDSAWHEGGATWSPPASDVPFLPGRFKQRLLMYKDNRHVFNASLVASNDASSAAVPIVAADFFRISEWFQAVVRQQEQMGGGSLDRVLVPCDVTHEILDAVVTGMYTGSLHISATTLGPLLQLATSTLTPALIETCSNWALTTLQDTELTPRWMRHLHSLTLRMELPTIQAAVTELVMQNDARNMAEANFHWLADVLEDQASSAAAGPSPAQQAVSKLRAAVCDHHGSQYPEEVFLVWVLVKLSQQGLRVAPMLACIDSSRLHELDVQALVDSKQACGGIEDDNALFGLLLDAMVPPSAASEGQHAAVRQPDHFDKDAPWWPAVRTVRNSAHAGRSRLIVLTDAPAEVGLYLVPPANSMVKDVARTFHLYTISGSQLLMWSTDLQKSSAAPGVGYGMADVKELLPSCTGIMGGFLCPL